MRVMSTVYRATQDGQQVVGRIVCEFRFIPAIEGIPELAANTFFEVLNKVEEHGPFGYTQR